MTPAQHFASTLNIPKARVLRFKGLEKTQEYSYDVNKNDGEFKDSKTEEILLPGVKK